MLSVGWLAHRDALSATPTEALDPRRVVVADFENRTGDPALDQVGAMLADWVSQGLQGSGAVEVIDPQSRLSTARRLAERRRGSEDPEFVPDVAREVGAGTVVTGIIYRQGGTLHYSASISDASTGKVRVAPEPVTVPGSDPLGGADLLRERVTGALAWALDTRIPSLAGPANHPPSFEAYREYMRGLDAFQTDHYDVALPHFEAAARADTAFDTPLVWAYFALSGKRGRDSDRRTVLNELGNRRERLAPLDRLALEYFEAQDRGDQRKQDEALYAAARMNPGSAWGFMAGQKAVVSNRLREGLHLLERVVPENGWVRVWGPYWKALANAYHGLEMYEQELAALETKERLDPNAIPRWDGIMSRTYRVRALAAIGRHEEALRLLQATPWSTDDAIIKVWWLAGLEFRAHGHAPQARVAFERALDLCRSPEAAAWADADSGEREARRLRLQVQIGKLLYELERWDDARSILTPLEARLPSNNHALAELNGYLGLIAARAGEGSRALSYRARLDQIAADEDGGSLWSLLASVEISELLGDREGALTRLESLPGRNRDIAFLELHRAFEMKELRTAPRFIQVERPRE